MTGPVHEGTAGRRGLLHEQFTLRLCLKGWFK